MKTFKARLIPNRKLDSEASNNSTCRLPIENYVAQVLIFFSKIRRHQRFIRHQTVTTRKLKYQMICTATVTDRYIANIAVNHLHVRLIEVRFSPCYIKPFVRIRNLRHILCLR